MSKSITEIQRGIILDCLQSIVKDQWKYLVCDKESEHLLDTIATRDIVLGKNYADLQLIEDTRLRDKDTPAVYFLTPREYVIEWLKADVNCRRYRETYLVWTSTPPPKPISTLDIGPNKYIKSSTNLNIDYTPQESQLITFREPDSLQILYNPTCKDLLESHLENLAQKIISVCVSLGEHPVIRYYEPSYVCRKLADILLKAFPHIPQQPRATLIIAERSMDIMAPLVHELTFQAMTMDLLPINAVDGKIEYPHQTVDENQRPVTKQKELNDKEENWVKYRHLHMKDLPLKLKEDFQAFQAKNIQFTDMDDQHINVNTIRDMVTGLPKFQVGKESFSLLIDMAQECATIFENQKLPDVTLLEQSLATGLDEDNQRPKNITDQLVRLLADESVILENRARLLMMYIIYRGGILRGDIDKLLSHGEILDLYGNTVVNLQNLGVKINRELGDNTNEYRPLYPAEEIKAAPGTEISLSRFEPMLRYALKEIYEGKSENPKFEFISDKDRKNQQAANQDSLRSTSKPTTHWATIGSKSRQRQRIIVFMAGGATYSEARVCYDFQRKDREVLLTTTHMITPKDFILEAGRLNQSRTGLRLKTDRTPEKPQWMREPPPDAPRPQQPASQQRPSQTNSNRTLAERTNKMNLGPPKPQNSSSRPGSAQTPTPPASAGTFLGPTDLSSGKPKKDKIMGIFKRH